MTARLRSSPGAWVVALALFSACSRPGKAAEKDAQIAALQVRVDELTARLAARDAQLAAQLAATSAPDLAPAPPPSAAQPAVVPVADTAADPLAPRARSLRALSAYFESNIPRLSREFHLTISDLLDDFGRVRDPAGLCVVLREGYQQKYADGSQAALIRAIGAELGTQVWNGSLCEGPTITRGLAPPTSQDLVRAFSAKIEADAVGWSHVLEIPLAELIDDTGHLRNAADAARREHDLLDAKHHDWDQAITVFGNELGTAIHFNRVGN